MKTYNKVYITSNHSVSMKYIAIIFFFLLLLIPISSATIYDFGTFKQSEDINLIQICSSCTYNNITAILYPNSTVAISNVEMTANVGIFNYTFKDTSTIGRYLVNGFGDIGGVDTEWNYEFRVTRSGSSFSYSEAIIYIVILMIVVILFLISVYSIFNMKAKNIATIVTLVLMAYFSIVAILYLSWQYIDNCVTIIPAIANILQVLFIISLAGVFPLFIGLFVYLIEHATRSTQDKNMKDVGYSDDEISSFNKKK